MGFGKDIWKWADRIPSAPHLTVNAQSRLTLGEGGTPLVKALTAGEIDPRESIVCLVTGSAFKDPPSIERMNQSIHVPTVDINSLTSLLQQP